MKHSFEIERRIIHGRNASGDVIKTEEYPAYIASCTCGWESGDPTVGHDGCYEQWRVKHIGSIEAEPVLVVEEVSDSKSKSNSKSN